MHLGSVILDDYFALETSTAGDKLIATVAYLCVFVFGELLAKRAGHSDIYIILEPRPTLLPTFLVGVDTLLSLLWQLSHHKSEPGARQELDQKDSDVGKSSKSTAGAQLKFSACNSALHHVHLTLPATAHAQLRNRACHFCLFSID